MTLASGSRIPKDHFLHAAPNSVGQQVNINHVNCNAGNDTRQRLYVKRTNSGIVAYCHNCGEYGVASNKGYRDFKVINDILKADKQQLMEAVAVSVPDDTTYSLPDFHQDALNWLYKAQLSDVMIRNYRIGYSPSWGRTILPVYDGAGNLIFWQGRAIGSIKPKYISVSGSQKPYKVLKNSAGSDGVTLIITEDMLSSIRVAEKSGRGFDGLPLLGTTISTIDLNDAISGYSNIAVWLDDDEAGRSKASKLLEQLKLLRGKDSLWRIDQSQASKLADLQEGYQCAVRI